MFTIFEDEDVGEGNSSFQANNMDEHPIQSLQFRDGPKIKSSSLFNNHDDLEIQDCDDNIISGSNGMDNMDQQASSESILGFGKHRKVKIHSDADRTENLPPSLVQSALNQQNKSRVFGAVLSEGGSSSGSTQQEQILGGLQSRPGGISNRTMDNEEEEEDKPFDKYWNIQLPNTRPSVSSQLNTTMNRSSNSNSAVGGADLLMKSPMAARLLSPSTRNAISNISTTSVKSTINESSFHRNRVSSSDENFENYVHDTFGTSKINTLVTKRPAITVFEDDIVEKSTIEEQYLFGQDEEGMETINVNRNMEKRPTSQSNQYTSPLKKRKFTSQPLTGPITENDEDVVNCSLVISPPPFDEEEGLGPSSAANNMLFGNDDDIEYRKATSPILEAGLYTGRSRDRKSRIKSSYYEPGSPLNTGLENNPSITISSSPLLKYTMPSTDSELLLNRAINLNDSITNRSSILNESLREKDDIIDQLNSEAEGERRRIKEYKLLIDRLQSENSRLKQQNLTIKKSHDDIVLEIEKENNSREIEIQLLNEKISEQQSTIKELQTISKNQKESKYSEIESKISGINKTVENLKSEIVQKDITIEAMNSQLASITNQLEEATTNNSELVNVYHSQKHEFDLLTHEYEQLTFKASQYESKLEELIQSQAEIKILKGELNERNEDKRRIRDLELELQKAAQSLQSQEVLKEAIKDFESELTKLEILRVENTSLESKLYNTDTLLKSWESAFPESTPSDVNYNIKLQAKKITRLEETIQEVNQEKSDIVKHVERLSSELELRESECSELRNEKKLVEEKLSSTEVKLFAAKKQLESSMKFARINDKEEAITEVTNEDTKEKVNHHMNRIAELEKIIEEKDVNIRELFERLDILQVQMIERQTMIENFEHELEKVNTQKLEAQTKSDDLQSRVEKLEKNRDSLELEIANYEKRLGKGEYNKEKFKILHMKFNPEIEAKKSSDNDIERLKTENKLLTDEITSLKEQLQTSSNNSASNTISNQREIEKLKEENADSQRRITKLKEVFQKKINEFRKSIYLLFGFRVDVIENNRFRLSSMYAESPEDYLIFESDGNTMKLLNSEFACSLEDKCMRFLKNFRSIPGFLCSVTLDLFNKQTVFTH